jgi:cytochrome c oxidase assembly factor CtaG
MKSNKWLKSAKYFATLFIVIQAIYIATYMSTAYFDYYQPTSPGFNALSSEAMLLIQAIGILVTAIGTLSSLFIAWQLDHRQARKAVRKAREDALKIAELEKKLADLKPDAGRDDAEAHQTGTAETPSR